MGFVQIIKLRGADYEGLEAAHAEWLRATEGQRTVTRVSVCENRDDAGEFWVIVEFPSFDDAMRNNDLPATGQIAEQMAALSGGQMEFVNLDLRRQD